MANPIPSYLRIHPENPPTVEKPFVEAFPSLENVCRAFEETTGWTLRYVEKPQNVSDFDLLWSAPVNPGVGAAPGHLRIEIGPSSRMDGHQGLPLEAASELAEAIASMLGDLARAEHVVWQREAELAAGVPVVAPEDGQLQLAARLEAALKGGAEAVGCRVAALYLLDTDTTVLKLRSSWGMPVRKLTDPARGLESSLADLEALLGHAVVLDSTAADRPWNPPEDFPAAVCVPVSTSTVPLGTLWMFSDEPRRFSEHDTNIIELVAGRIATDLEREMLLQDRRDRHSADEQVQEAATWQRSQLPTLAPLVDGWQLSAWNHQHQAPSGDFYDWWLRDNDGVTAIIGDALDGGLDAALSAANLKGLFRATDRDGLEPDAIVSRVSNAVWSGSQGDQFASAALATIESNTGRVHLATAGNVAVLRITDAGWQSLSQPSPVLGTEPDTAFANREVHLEPGELFVLATDGVCDARDDEGCRWGEQALAELLMPHCSKSVDQLLAMLRTELATHTGIEPNDDQTVLMLKREG